MSISARVECAILVTLTVGYWVGWATPAPMLAAFFNMGFWQSFVVEITATGLGVALGVWTGLYLSHKEQERAALAEAEAQRREDLRIREVIRSSLLRNAKILGEISDFIAAGGPDLKLVFNVDLTLLEATAKIKYDHLHDAALCAEIDRVRYGLEQVRDLVSTMQGVTFNPTARVLINFSDGGKGPWTARMLPPIHGALRENLTNLIATCNFLANRLDTK